MMMRLSQVLFFFIGWRWRWRNACKCKKLLKSLQSRLKLLKNKKSIMAKLLRQDIALLLQLGYYHLAISRAEKLAHDENTAELYHLLHCYCEFLLLNFSYIRKNKECPNDIKEAMSSLVFASTTCEELPELAMIRDLFVRRYRGKGNLLNSSSSQVVENILLTKSVPDDAKYRLVDEISKTVIKSSEPQQQQEKFNTPDSSIFSICLSNVSHSSSSSSSSCSILSPEMESFILLNPRIIDQKWNESPKWEMVPYTYTNSSSSSPEVESFIVLNPEDGRILKPDSYLYLKSSDMQQLIPYNNNNNNNKDDYYQGYLPTNSRNHLQKKKMVALDHGNCKHVHPKLPDYDQLVAKFTAIKRSNLLLANNSKKL